MIDHTLLFAGCSIRGARASMRVKLNLIGSLGGLDRTDGVVEVIVGDEANVEWTNDACSVESTPHQVQITG